MDKIKKIETIRHSLAHIMATAVQELYPGTKFGIGPAIESGFYYDFDLPKKISPEDLPKIEKKMRELIKKDIKFEKKIISKEEAKKIFKDQPYKLELIKEIPEKKVSIYKSGDFVDLCKGPHIKSTKNINSDGFKLTKIAGAYWRGNEKNKMLVRIYGLAFETKKELGSYLQKLDYAEKYNHRKIGKELELFAISQEVGQGLPIWLPNGFVIRRVLEDYMIQFERSYGYQHIITPHINKKELFELSGHLDYYKESMYSPIKIDNEIYYLKPMNCPAGMIVYKMKSHSYRELPLKLGELGTVYRYEKSGELHGLERVRGFTQNDAHIFCAPEQLEDQFIEIIEMLEKFYKDLGFTNYKYRLSLSDKNSSKYVGSQRRWKQAENTLKKVLSKHKIKFIEAIGEAAFYGPKLDIQAVNVFGKEDTISTIQFDFNLPERFDLTYINDKGKSQRPFVLHRALIGSFERFFAFLIEFYAGAFPVWLSPIQAQIISVSQKFNQYGKEVAKQLQDQGIRAKLNNNNETLSKKIRQGEKQKIPYLLIVGDKETRHKSVRIRKRKKGDIGEMKLDKFIKKIKKEIKNKL